MDCGKAILQLAGEACLQQVQSAASSNPDAQKQLQQGDGGYSSQVVNVQVTDNTAINTDDIIRGWQQAVNASSAPTTISIPQGNGPRWSTSLDGLTLILADAINEIFQEIPAFSESLRYEALLGVTINNKTTFVFSLQGFAGQVTNQQMGWTRQNMQTNKIKNKMEDALCRVCWEQAVNVTSLRIEGTTTIIVDNKDVILIQLDQKSFAPKGKVKNINAKTQNVKKETSKRSGKEVKETLNDLNNDVENKSEGEEQSEMGEESESEDENYEDEERSETDEDVVENNEKSEEMNEKTVKINEEKKAGNKNSYKCEDCGIWLSCSSLASHRKMHKFGAWFLCAHEGCDRKFLTKQALEAHSDVHSNKKKYVCDVCGREYHHLANLNRHLRTTGHKKQSKPKLKSSDKCNKKKTFVCDQCGKYFATRKGLDIHADTHETNKTIACEVEGCDMKFTNRRGYKDHLVSHGQNKNFVCNVCGKKFFRRSYLHKHKRLFCGEKPHKCDQCDQHFKLLKNLELHKLKHGKFQCEICLKVYPLKERLRKHQQIYHDNSEKGFDGKFKCNICDRRYHHSSGLVRHLLVHKNQRDYVCKICNKSFIDRSYHRDHMLLHKDEAPYQCNVCGRMFKWATYLKRHSRIHTGETPYKCCFCDKKFRFTSSLSQHKKRCAQNPTVK